MTEVFREKQDCCGCTACYSICPQKAINMVADSEGFKYPTIDTDKCIDCKLCQKVCAFQSKIELNKNISAWAVRHQNEEICQKSSSGGVFTALSDKVLLNGGVVYGVRFNENFVATHSRATTSTQRDEFRGSKYVQSEMGNIFYDVQKDLREDKIVFFTGTPCQCAGLKIFLVTSKTSQENLILCDVICHGVPSPRMFEEHIDLLQRKNKSKLIGYYCRSKINGWHSHTEMAVFENGTTDYTSEMSQEHKKTFYSHNVLRVSCHNCKYTSVDRVSDITMADCRTIDEICSEFNDDKGVSTVLLNTHKGVTFFESLLSDNVLNAVETAITKCMQPQLIAPAVVSKNRDSFWRDYYKKGYEYVINKYIALTLVRKIKIFIKKALLKVYRR